MNASKSIQQLPPQSITSANFQRYGQVIYPGADGKLFDADDAQLILNRGIPRFYLMQLKYRGQKFHHLNRHLQCTQCLGALAYRDWLIAVCPPNNDVDVPDLQNIAAFRIAGDLFIKLHLGTWHSGPYFQHQFVNFYNLELSNTNVVDNQTYNILQDRNLEFEIV